MSANAKLLALLVIVLLCQYVSAWSCYCRTSSGARDCHATAGLTAEYQYNGEHAGWEYATNDGGCHTINY
ncbi:hypothetical protein BC940DRAFT_329374 [Gongronella butleri]|nr:hypothetical protein BC940DRAFT_329374 [Gongronella butleri]